MWSQACPDAMLSTLRTSPQASRQREYRQRVRDGRVVLSVECDEIAVAGLLADAGLLKPGADDRGWGLFAFGSVRP